MKLTTISLMSLTVLVIFGVTSIPVHAASCEDNVISSSNQVLKVYVDTISGKGSRETFASKITEALSVISQCMTEQSLPYPMKLDSRRGWYRGVNLMLQYSGLENVSDRPTLKNADELYARLNKIQPREVKKP